MDKDTILEQNRLSTNLETIEGILLFLQRTILKAHQGKEVEEHELINGSNQIDTGLRILHALQDNVNLHHSLAFAHEGE